MISLPLFPLSHQDRCCHYLAGAKSTDKGIAFSPDGLQMAQLERYECRDHVSVYDTASWTRLRHFEAATEDAAELSWSPDGGYLALMDGPLNYRVCVYAAADGRSVVLLYGEICVCASISSSLGSDFRDM